MSIVILNVRVLRGSGQTLHLLEQVVSKSRKRFEMIYQKRISGPLLDRIDIHVEVPRVEYEKLSESRLGESSAHGTGAGRSCPPATAGALLEYRIIQSRYVQRGYAPGGGA